MSRRRPPTTCDAGAAAVEMALVLPILMLLICGIIDFGRAYNTQLTLTHAAREGARVWALGGTQATVTTRVTDATDGMTGVSVTTTTCTFGSATTVTVTASFTYITPMIANLVPSITSLSGKGVMRCGG